MSNSISNVLKNTVLVIVSVLVSLLIAEGVIRVLIPPLSDHMNVSRIGRERIMNPLPGIRYLYNSRAIHKEAWPSDPNGYFDPPDNSLTYKTNNYGFRDRDFSLKLDDRYRIAIIGDSFCWGAGVRRNDRFSNQLEQQLNETGPLSLEFEVLNFCLPGHNTENEAALYEYVVDKFSPDLLLVSFFLNDINLPPELYVFPRGILQLNKPSEWIKKSRLLTMVFSVVSRHRVQRNFIEHAQDVYQPTHPAFRKMQQEIERISNVSQAHGRKTMMVLFPWLFKLSDNEYPFRRAHSLVMQTALSNNIETLDLLQAYSGMDKADLWVHAIDHHPNTLGHTVAADAIFNKVSKVINNDTDLVQKMDHARQTQLIPSAFLESREDWYVPFLNVANED